MAKLTNLRVAVIAAHGVEESELTEPVHFLKDHGAHVEILSPVSGPIQAFRCTDKGDTIPVDRTLDQAEVRPENYNALFLPGGLWNADALRTDLKVQAFARLIDEEGKPIVAIGDTRDAAGVRGVGRDAQARKPQRCAPHGFPGRTQPAGGKLAAAMPPLPLHDYPARLTLGPFANDFPGNEPANDLKIG